MTIEEHRNIYVGLFKNIKHRALRTTKRCRARQYIGVEMAEWRVFPDTLINLSSYGIIGKRAFLREHIQEMKDTDWIVCPVQLKNSSSSLWDIQIGVTGKCKNSQEPHEAMLLELEEELGLRWIGPEPIQGVISEDNQEYERTIFKIPSSNCVSIEKDEMPITGGGNKEIAMQKIACLIYGSKDDLEKVINKTNKLRYYSSNDDNIIGNSFVAVQTIKKRFCIS